MTAAKALVLGGGGVTGVAWEIGMLAGLASRGLDLTDADLVIGTSAGSVVGAGVRSGADLAELYRTQTTPADGEITAKLGVGVMLRYVMAAGLARDPVRARRRIGALAIRARTAPESARRAVIESRVPIREWPAGALRITAVDAASGEFVIFDASGGAGVVDAVGASCAVPGVWPPVTIAGRRYIDGGMRSPANADLAAGYGRVVVIAPLPRGFGPRTSVHVQARELRSGGSDVAVITPDRAAQSAIGRNVLDPARRIPAAEAGWAQSAAALPAVAAVWGSH